MIRVLSLSITLVMLLIGSSVSACAQEGDGGPIPPTTQEDTQNPATKGQMSAERLGFLIERVDPNAQQLGNGYVFTIEERALRVVYDENADRMRIITPLAEANELPEGLLLRMMQANFDAVLDSRYAVGSGMVWSVFIHRLSTLTDDDFLSGIAQTAVAAETFGTTFTSGAFVFGGGDSADLNDRLLDSLRDAIENAEEEDRGI